MRAVTHRFYLIFLVASGVAFADDSPSLGRLFTSASDRAQLEAPPPVPAQTPKRDQTAVQGIVAASGQLTVWLNGQRLRVGENSADGTSVERVEGQTVIVRRRGHSDRLQLKPGQALRDGRIVEIGGGRTASDSL